MKKTIIHHWMPEQTVTPTFRKYGVLYRLKSARVTKTGGVMATYVLP